MIIAEHALYCELLICVPSHQTLPLPELCNPLLLGPSGRELDDYRWWPVGPVGRYTMGCCDVSLLHLHPQGRSHVRQQIIDVLTSRLRNKHGMHASGACGN
ncbi:uncharacterized protein LOC124369855 [Homalodisca vitripennis]|uniref:uncharacterized protein LOC124369855 n=1 Tax=Homalodisca vitripennis TaxID=197043 RepID=UPI001EEC5720|nr:uncharacterized protein LOC124369855 [Homalodisca vitripennis]